MSRSTWACELKSAVPHSKLLLSGHAPRERVSWNWPLVSFQLSFSVTLHVSVWVEIQRLPKLYDKTYRHAPRERVSWNINQSIILFQLVSHAPRERVSWNMEKRENLENINLSRSTWACELKFSVNLIPDTPVCHAPRERVSWNLFYKC